MALAELWQIYLSLIILQGFYEKVITLGCGRLDWNNLSYMCEGFFFDEGMTVLATNLRNLLNDVPTHLKVVKRWNVISSNLIWEIEDCLNIKNTFRQDCQNTETFWIIYKLLNKTFNQLTIIHLQFLSKIVVKKFSNLIKFIYKNVNNLAAF